MNDGGVFHFHSYVPRHSRFTRAMYKTIRNVFPSVIVVGETELIASTSPLHHDPEVLRERIEKLEVHFPGLSRRLETLTTERLPVEDVPLLTDDYAPVDTLLRGVRAQARER